MLKESEISCFWWLLYVPIILPLHKKNQTIPILSNIFETFKFKHGMNKQSTIKLIVYIDHLIYLNAIRIRDWLVRLVVCQGA